MYLKYLKYKNKYLELKNQIGGKKPPKITKAFDKLNNFFKNGLNVLPVLAHMNTDDELKKLVLNAPVLFTVDNTKDDTIIKKIFCAIIFKMRQTDVGEIPGEEKIVDIYNENCYDDDPMSINKDIIDNIDWIIDSYIKITIPNIETLKNVMKDIKKYGNNYKELYGYEPLLQEHDPKIFLKPLASILVPKPILKSNYEIILEETLVLNTDKLSIHVPKTKEQSIKLGRNTKWCTAADSATNMFETYNKDGSLYIIIPKVPIRENEKYQLHEKTIMYMDENDEPIKLTNLKERFNDVIFNTWLLDKFYVDLHTYMKLLESEYHLIKKLDLTDLFLDKRVNLDKLNKLTSLTHLIFGNKKDFPICKGVLPHSLQHLTFGEEYGQPIGEDVLPPSLTHLTFGIIYDQPIDVDVLPKSLTHLTFGYDYDKEIDEDVLPESLTHLTFGYAYDKQIDVDVLPKSLTHLTFGDAYDKQIGLGVLPQTLTHLTFGLRYNKMIGVGVLPRSLTHLTFMNLYGSLYEIPILRNVLLNTSLTHLTLGFKYNTQINVLPKTLEHLTFGNDYDKQIDKGVLPESLTHLTFGYKYNMPFGNILASLPLLTNLTFGDSYDKPIDNLPKSLTHLTFGGSFSVSVPEVLKNLSSLTHLTFGDNYMKSIFAGALPMSLKHLTFGNNYSGSIELNGLPKSLTHLTFGHACEFTRVIEEGVLPESLTHLTFGDVYTEPIVVGALPKSLTHLIIGDGYEGLKDTNGLLLQLSSSLIYLKINKRFKDIILKLKSERRIKIQTIEYF